jgi:hypothetical protein
MARRRHRRRYNPDPVAAVAAAIPASVPAPVAKAAIAGAAAAASKTNPRRGKRSRRYSHGKDRNKGYGKRWARAHMSKKYRHGRLPWLKSARSRRNCGYMNLRRRNPRRRNPRHDGSPTRGELKAARRAARAGTPAVLIRATPRVMDYAGVKIPVAPGESLRTYLHRLHQYKKRHAPDPSIYARMERARTVKEFRGPAWKARKQVMWHLGRRGTRKLKDLPGTRANPRKSGVRTSAEYEKFRRYWVAKAKDDPSAFERAFARSVLSEHGGRYHRVKAGYDPITGQRNPLRRRRNVPISSRDMKHLRHMLTTHRGPDANSLRHVIRTHAKAQRNPSRTEAQQELRDLQATLRIFPKVGPGRGKLLADIYHLKQLIGRDKFRAKRRR